jgi:DNA-directed RNA polymerase specialized sigma24 family protein
VAGNFNTEWWRGRHREIPLDWSAIDGDVEVSDSTRPPAIPISDRVARGAVPVYGEPYDETDVDDAWRDAVVKAFIADLPEDLRAVHHHRFVMGMSQRDAASALGIGRQAIRSRENRLTGGLRAALARGELSRAPGRADPIDPLSVRATATPLASKTGRGGR